MKRKCNDEEELSNSSSSLFHHQLKLRRSQISTSSLDPENSNHRLASCSSSNHVSTTDLQEVSSGGVESATTATFNVGQTERKETRAKMPPSTVTVAKMPSDAELEDFFSAAEKDFQKQFSIKYNFDVPKEEPLEGRYEWVRVNP